MIEIVTNNLIIRSFQESDIADEYIEWLNNKELMTYSEQRHINHTKATSQEYLESFYGTENYFFAIESRQKRFLGTLTVYQDTNNKIFDMGILIGSEKARGKGFGSEAWAAVMVWIEENFQVRKITAGAIDKNKAMLGVMRKCGMTDDGTRKQHFLHNNDSVDIVYMAKSF